MVKKLTDKLLTIYEIIWYIGVGFVLLFFVFGFFWMFGALRYFPLIALIPITLTIIRILLVRKFHAISKKALAYETITRSEFEFWKKRTFLICFDNNYEEYLQTSLSTSEKKLDKALKDKLIEKMKCDWEKKTYLDKIFYFFRYENCDFPEYFVNRMVVRIQDNLELGDKQYCPFCKKITDNEKCKDDVFKPNFVQLSHNL